MGWNIGRAVSRAIGVNKGGTVSRALGGPQGVAAVIAVATAIAIPFAAPIVAGAIFGSTSLLAMTAAGAMIGAAGGALSGSMVGNVGRGALIGGASGAVAGFGQAGGFTEVGNALFGPGVETAAAPGTSGFFEGASAPGEAGYFVGGGAPPGGGGFYEGFSAPGEAGYFAGGGAGTPGSAATTGGFTPAVPPGAAVVSAAPQTGAGSAVSAGNAASAGGTGLNITQGGVTQAAKPVAETGSWGSRFAAGLTGAGTKMDLTTAEGVGRALSPVASPAGLAGVGQLAMTMFNKPPEGLTTQERAYLDETAALAGTNRELFDQRVQTARRLLQQGQANPEQAYAQANIGVQRRFREAGLRNEGDERRALIEGARLGTLAAATEQGRASQATVAGLSAMPGSAPIGPTALGLPAYRESERRQREYDRDLSSGFATLASAFGGRSRAGLFSS